MGVNDAAVVGAEGVIQESALVNPSAAFAAYQVDHPLLVAALRDAGIAVVEVASPCTGSTGSTGSAGGAGGVYGHGNVEDMVGWVDQAVNPMQLCADLVLSGGNNSIPLSSKTGKDDDFVFF